MLVFALLLPLCALARLDDKHPVPSAAEQKTAEKQLRTLLKEDYDKVGHQSKVALYEKLLLEAKSTKDDATLFALLKDARDVAADDSDLGRALAAIDLLADRFDVKADSMKAALWSSMRKAATSESLPHLLNSCLRVAKASLRGADFDASLRWAKEAEQLAKSLKDPAPLERVKEVANRIAEAKKERLLVSQAELTLAERESPESRLVMARNACFTQGDWPKGVRLIEQIPDQALRDIARKELSPPESTEAVIDLAESWWESSQKKERSAIDRRWFQFRSRYWYERAVAMSSGLEQAKLEKKAEEIGRSQSLAQLSVDLMGAIDLREHVLAGTWDFQGQKLVATSQGRIQIPYRPPDEYDLTVVLEKKQPTEMVLVGLVAFGRQVALIIDNLGGTVSGLDQIAGQAFDNNETTVRSRVILDEKPKTLKISIRKSRFRFSVDGKRAIEWKNADFSRVNLWAGIATPKPGMMFLSGNPNILYSKLVLTPISDLGQETD